ncbi:MAG: amidohydrolase family protein [Myxococcales bacterium]|nr:amidohydrolase family protein [Myxococcales bacterium]
MRPILWSLVALPWLLTAVSCGGEGSGGGGINTGGSGNQGAAGGSGGAAGGGGGLAGGGGAAGGGGVAGSTGGSGGSTGGTGGSTGGSGGSTGGTGGGTGGTGGITSPPATLTKGAPDRFLLKGAVITPSGALAGEVLVESKNITCVAASCSSQPGATGATVIETNGVIVPGLIDPHNHGLFNLFDESDWTPQKLYTNHNHWTDPSKEPRYTQTVDAKQALESASGSNVACEMNKFAETKALIAGTTSFLVAAGERKCFASLVRTIDTAYNDLETPNIDPVRTAIAVPSGSDATTVCNAIQAGDTFVVHVAEGTDGPALNEFTSLSNAASGCLINSHVTIVHGTALQTTHFQTMATANMGLVWSPKSNVFLYAATTDIPAAMAAGVKKIALGPDWALGGSVNMLDELRFADGYDNSKWGDKLSTKKIVEMGTIEGARVLGVDKYVGSLEVGKRADLFVVPGNASNAYDAVLAATPATVRVTMVDGRVLYGDKALEAAGPSTPGCEALPLCGVDKFLCAAEASTADKLNQTYTEYRAALVSALKSYDDTVKPSGGPFSPIAPLTKCP